MSYSKRLFPASPFNPLFPLPHGPHWQCVTKGIWAFLGNGSPHDQAQSPLSVTFSPLAAEKEALNNRGCSAGDGGVSWVWELAHSLLISSLTLHVHLRPPQGAFVHPLLLITHKQPCLLLPCSLFKEKLLERQTDNVSRGVLEEAYILLWEYFLLAHNGPYIIKWLCMEAISMLSKLVVLVSFILYHCWIRFNCGSDFCFHFLFYISTLLCLSYCLLYLRTK